MNRTIIPFPWYLLIHADDETPLIVSGPDFDMLVVFTDLEFARLYAERSGSICNILRFLDPQGMVEFLEQLLDAASTVDDRPLTHAVFDPIEPTGDMESTGFEIVALLAALKKADR